MVIDDRQPDTVSDVRKRADAGPPRREIRHRRSGGSVPPGGEAWCGGLALPAERVLRGGLGALVRGVGAPGGQRAAVRRLRRTDARRGLRAPVRDDGGLGLELAELALEVRLEAAAVLALERPQ